MTTNKKWVAMLLAGGQGSRLAPLTKDIAKPAVPFGARYRIIDFSLSNCINSGIDTVGVLTQYQPMELNDYLGNGEPWDLDLRFGGLHKLPPYQAGKGGDWFRGTANAVYQNIRFIRKFSPEYVVILSGDHIYKMDYRKMLAEHAAKDADCTIAVIDVPLEEAGRFGIMSTDEDGRITEFAEKPAVPKSTKASMGVYIFDTEKLVRYLEEDERDPDSENDFGKNVIPRMLKDGCRMFSYMFEGYWRDVGTLDSYWSANMDMIGEDPGMILDDPGWKIYYRHGFECPTYVGNDSRISESIVGEGNELNGSVKGSVVFNSVEIEKAASVKDSVIMSGVNIGRDAAVDYAVVDSGAVIENGATVGGGRESGNLAVIGAGVRIGRGMTVHPGEIVTEDR